MRKKIAEVNIVGLVGFFAPFFGCAALAYYGLRWTDASWLAGIAPSTDIDGGCLYRDVGKRFELNKFGKGILGHASLTTSEQCCARAAVSPFTYKTVVFIAGTAIVLGVLPGSINWLTDRYGHRTAAIRTKWVMLMLFGLGALALWSGSEAVLPAYLAGMVLAGGAAKDVIGCAVFVR